LPRLRDAFDFRYGESERRWSLLHRQVGGLVSLEDPSGVVARLAIGAGKARRVAHQAAGEFEHHTGIFPGDVDRM
jgi:hypothetical protein